MDEGSISKYFPFHWISFPFSPFVMEKVAPNRNNQNYIENIEMIQIVFKSYLNESLVIVVFSTVVISVHLKCSLFIALKRRKLHTHCHYTGHHEPKIKCHTVVLVLSILLKMQNQCEYNMEMPNLALYQAILIRPILPFYFNF